MSDLHEKYAFGELPARAAARWGNREALEYGDDTHSFPESFSFNQISAYVDEAAKGLMSLGIAPEERVALYMGNRPGWIVLMFALAKVGAVIVPVNTWLRDEEIGYILNQSGACALIANTLGLVNQLSTIEEFQPALRDQDPRGLALDSLPHLRHVIAYGASDNPGVLDWFTERDAGKRISDADLQERARAVDPGDPLFIMYTSGTTGFPKGVVHNHNILRNVEERAGRMEITQNDVILMFLPLFHIFGFSEGPVSSLITGAKLVLTETFNPVECLWRIQEDKVTVTYGFDTHFKDLLSSLHSMKSPYDMSSLRTALVVAGMASSTEVARQANEIFCPTVTGYGMTEVYVGAALSFPDATLEQRTETSGYPMPGYEIRVVEPETGEDMPTGEPGEILVRGYGVMEGYYENPEQTAKTIDPQGWLHSGDMGLLREDGYLRFIGRYKDMLKVGGENVDPMEVENFLDTHPGIYKTAVVGYPDARLSEVAVAFFVPEPGAGPESLPKPEEVIEYCKGKIASFKIPRHVMMVEDFPMTSSGKVRKVELRMRALEQLGPPKED
ncbi:MAG: AMP-binding protein [bacterium]